MRNQYPGTCYRCGKHCAAGEGHFERVGRTWRVQHASCAIKYRGTDVGKPGATEARQSARVAHLKEDSKGTGKRAQRARKKLREMYQ